MIKQTVVGLLNTQINKELYSAYLYLSFANYYKQNRLDGFANYYMVRAQEKRDRAIRFIRYMYTNNLEITLQTIKNPEFVFLNTVDPLKAGLEHEQHITGLIHNIYNAAFETKDFRTMEFLNLFIRKQAEEEENAGSLVEKMNIFGSELKIIYMLDKELVKKAMFLID